MRLHHSHMQRLCAPCSPTVPRLITGCEGNLFFSYRDSESSVAWTQPLFFTPPHFFPPKISSNVFQSHLIRLSFIFLWSCTGSQILCRCNAGMQKYISLLCMCERMSVVHIHTHAHTVSGLGGWLIIWDDCRRPASEELPVTDEMCTTLYEETIEYGKLWWGRVLVA